MLAAAITLCLFVLVLTMVVDVIRRDSPKIVAALEGRSLASEPMPIRPVTVRFTQPRKVEQPRHLQPVLRAAA